LFSLVQTEVQNLEDAIMEIEEQFDDDACRVRIGDVFVSVSNEEAKERTEKELERSKQKLGKLQSEHEDIQSEMSSLKARLSAKFGDAINLETDEEKEARKKQ
jgi:chaperonin cofactor prefoldin